VTPTRFPALWVSRHQPPRWYRPVSQQTWNKLLVDKFFLKDPDQSALSYRSPTLQAIVELGKVRGLAKPEL
jgi:hypothetical protein